MLSVVDALLLLLWIMEMLFISTLAPLDAVYHSGLRFIIKDLYTTVFSINTSVHEPLTVFNYTVS